MSLFQSLASQLDLLSALLGAFVATLCSITLFALLTARLRKKLLISELAQNQLHHEIDENQEAILRIRRERDTCHNEVNRLQRQDAILQTRFESLELQESERQNLLEIIQKELVLKFEVLANEILAEKGMLLQEQQTSSLRQLLSPFNSQLIDFKQRVNELYDKETRDRLDIKHEIIHLRSLNERLSQDATNLTEALQGNNKLQGQWGEMILEKLLEESGLRKGVEFTTQKSFVTTKGSRKQPDVIIHLPEKRDIIIDAKVSLKAFTQAYNESDKKKRDKLLKEHIDSIKQHIQSLSNKKYHQLEGVNTVDFVLIFIPIEAAFQSAVESVPELLTAGIKKNVLLASPSTLFAILRTVNHLWRLDQQHRNGLIIAKNAGNLYDKFVGFIETFEEIGTRLDQSQRAWLLAKKRLSEGKGNLVHRAENLKKLGLQPERDMQEILKQPSQPEE